MSNGQSISKEKIDRNVSKAKKNYIENFRDQHSYLFCERTKRSDLPLERSHIISVKECQESGRSELAWCQNNLELLTRAEHLKVEALSKANREIWYWCRWFDITATSRWL